MKNIYAILPCYNEEENIGNLIEEWKKQEKELNEKDYNLKIIAIDDCSTDKTREVILKQKEKYNNVEIIIHEENKGLSGGLNSAINYFNKNGRQEDLMVLMDGDNTHDPKYVHKMLEKLKDEKNCIIASRYQEGSGIVGLAKNRELMSEFAKLYYKLTLNVPNVKDYTCGYRMYSYDIIDKLLKKFGDNPIKEKSFACMMELLYKVYLVGGNFDEVGFELRYDNKRGESKMKVFKTARRSLTTAIKLNLRYNIASLITMILLLAFSVFLTLATNYSPTSKSVLLHDCGIFSYVAFAMKEGRALYSEVWENKGPLLYFIYYIGLYVLNGSFGMYLLELISVFISVLFSYKTLYIITNKKIYSILGVIYAFSIWAPTWMGGTFSESFALPLICAGMFLYSKYMLKDKNISNIGIMFFGILTGLIAQLRLNMLSYFLAMFITIGILLIKNKEFKEILRWILWGIIGFVISIIPALIYLIKNGVLIDCINIAYLDILDGFNVGTIYDRLEALKEMIDNTNISGALTLTLAFIIVSVLLIIFRKVKKTENILYILAVILSVIINLYANSVSGAVHMHYFITFIPVVVMVVALTLKLFDKIDIYYFLKIIGLVILLIIFAYHPYRSYFYHIKSFSQPVDPDNSYVKITEYIVENTQEDDLVQFIGGREEAVSANFRSKRLSASEYSYLPLWSTFNAERKAIIINEVVGDIKTSTPKLIFVCMTNKPEFDALMEDKESWKDFLKENYSKDNKTIKNYIIYTRK